MSGGTPAVFFKKKIPGMKKPHVMPEIAILIYMENRDSYI
jgi:hypothetical protein